MRFALIGALVVALTLLVLWLTGFFTNFCVKYPSVCFWQSEEEQKEERRVAVYNMYDG
jgi:hypothetical protein